MQERPSDIRSAIDAPGVISDWFYSLSNCPWLAHAGSSSFRAASTRQPLYTPQERSRRDATVWTTVQAILAPLQFLVFLVSLGLLLRYLRTGAGYEIATLSIVAKTILLYTIMITGSIWEKVVFDKWLFARAFFWEDVFSMLVLGLQTLYLFALTLGWWTPKAQMMIAVAAYGAYVINATQFLLKLRAARLESVSEKSRYETHAPFGGHAA